MHSVTLNFADWLEAICRHSFFGHSFWHIFWDIFWHSSDLSSEILADISFDILSDISSQILYDISFDMLSDISSDILSDISKIKHSIHSFTQKPLHKLYIYLTPRSKSNIHDNFVSVKWQFYSCIRLHRTAPPRSNWVQRCKATQVSTQPQLHLMACANHEVRCLPLCLLHLFGVTGPARYNKNIGARCSNSCSPSSFGTALPSYNTYHKVPSTTSGTMSIQSPACIVLGGSMHT